MNTVRQHLATTALEKGLRQTTVISYERLLTRMGLMDLEVAAVSQEAALEALWTIDNPNSRRAAVIAIHHDVQRPPAGAFGGAAAILQRGEKGVPGERVGMARQPVPVSGGNLSRAARQPDARRRHHLS